MYCHVPYQEDPGAVLEELRHRVVVAGEYYWVHGDDRLPEGKRRPLPSSPDELWADVFHVQRKGEEPEVCAVQPVTAAEARRVTGTERLTREHVQAVQGLARERGYGRCAVLCDDQGTP
ncbi:hypothetical protein GTW46_38895 [Streptomyces sp. SID6013]|nr:hypothetical protein [Streptomyces sp. SID6013]